MSVTYRPEIDGLRTVSVLLVILSHLGWTLLPGGYVGVDVFFVISGFLITSIVVAEIRTGTFTIANFYKRRVIRLAPAYFLVLAVTSIAAILIMLPDELLAYFKSVIYSTFFAANIYMWREVGGYFASQSDVIPLLHLWSLAVEEQFYIIWPLALLIGLRVTPPRFLWIVLVLAILVCLFISEWGIRYDKTAAYYLMPTRVFELMLGALLVFLPQRDWHSLVRNIMGLVGLGLILYSALTYVSGQRFPGFAGLLPCLGAVLILTFCKGASDITGKLLATAPMVAIGKVSYPAYLWHWPIIAFLNICMIEIDFVVGATVMVLTLALSFFTYWYVENPAKRFNRESVKRVAGYGFAMPALLFFCVSGYAMANKGWPVRFPESLNLKSAAVHSLAHKERRECHAGDVTRPRPEDYCVLGVRDRPVDFLLVGDSHANHFAGMIDVMAREAGVRGYDVTQGNTIFLAETARHMRSNDKRVEDKRFSSRNKTLESMIAEKKYKAVILGGAFASHYNKGHFKFEGAQSPKEAFQKGFELTIRKIKDSGAAVFIINGSPIMDDVDHACVLKNERFSLENECSISIETHAEFFSGWKFVLAELLEAHPDINIIDTESIICNEGKCASDINGIPLYSDAVHLNHIGSQLLGEAYLSTLGNPLINLERSAGRIETASE